MPEPAVDREPEADAAVPSWQPSADETKEKSGNRFSGFALILAAIVGMVAGFAAGYMARPRALQTARQEITAGTDAPVRVHRVHQGAQGAPGAPGAQSAPGAPPADRGTDTAHPVHLVHPVHLSAPAKIGRLLVRSTPSGASVEVDGVARGVTPLALRDLDLGAREITVTRRGYVPEERRIVLTKARPSRSMEVRLSVQAARGATTAKHAGVARQAARSQPEAWRWNPFRPARR